MKKTIITFLASIILILGLLPSNPISAKNQTNKSITTNEYETLKQLSKQSDFSILSKGYNKQELDIIRNIEIEYPKHLIKYKTFSKEDLENLGYTEEQITLLRNYEGQEEQTIKLAATVNTTLSELKLEYSPTDDKTYTKFRYRFAWSGVPLFKMKDIIAVSWNDWNLTDTMVRGMRYADVMNSQNLRGDLTPVFVKNNGPNNFGAGYKFDMAIEDNRYYAQTGVFDFELYNHGKKNLSVYAEYGHNTLGLNPVFSIPGLFSIDFSTGINIADSTHLDIEIP